MKKLFAILMSFQLILSPLAFAAEPVVDAYNKSGTNSAGGYDFYMNQILVLGTSAVGSSIISQCPAGMKIPSIATFMAGSLVQIIAEIAAAVEKKEETEEKKMKMADLKKMADIEIKDGLTVTDDTQKELMEARMKEEESVLKFVSKRKGWMIAITTIYTAAMGLAILEETTGLASGTSTATAACATYTASCTAGAAFCGPHCAAGVTAAIVKIKAVQSLPQARALLTAECAPYLPSPGCQAFAQWYLSLVYGACLVLPPDGGALSLSWGTALTLGYGIGMSAVGGGAGELSQYGSMILMVLPLVIKGFNKIVMKAYNFPIPRAITFGAAAALSGLVTAGLAHREKVAKANIEKLRKAIDAYKVGTTVTTEVTTGPSAVVDPAGTYNPLKASNYLIKPPSSGRKCASKSGGAFSISSANCKNPLRISKSNFGKVRFPGMNKVGMMSENLAEALANGNNAGAASMAGQIAGLAGRIKLETKAIQDQFNAIQKKNGRPTTDFDKSVKAQVAAMQASFKGAAAASKMDMSGLGSSSTPDDPADETSDSTDVTSVGVPGVDIPSDGMGGFSMEDEMGPLEEKTGETLEDFESTEHDVSKQSEVSIFKQLTNRYILNYTKIFERKKETEVVNEPEEKQEQN
jgi:peptidoglycan hydrolase-like protein with peptidoglycan-binding domain